MSLGLFVLFVAISLLSVIASVILITVITKELIIGAAWSLLITPVLFVSLCQYDEGRFRDVLNESGIVFILVAVIVSIIAAITVITGGNIITGTACGLIALALFACLLAHDGERFKGVPNENGTVCGSETLAMYDEGTMSALYDASGEPLLYEGGEKG